jgi:hypothetical protein
MESLSWTAGVLMGSYALFLGYFKTQTKRRDAAGNAVATAYWAFALAAWIVLAVLTFLGWWLHSPILLLAPLLPLAAPLLYVMGRSTFRAAEGVMSRMPTGWRWRVRQLVRR